MADLPRNPDMHGASPRDAARPRPGSAAVILRFVARMMILGLFAAAGTRGYAMTFETLLGMAAVYCAIVAPFRRELPFGPVLTHFDEAAAYAVCALAVSLAA